LRRRPRGQREKGETHTGRGGGDGEFTGTFRFCRFLAIPEQKSDAVADGGGQRAGTSLRQRAPRAGYQLNFWLVFTATSAIGIAANLFVFFPVYIVKLGGDAASIGAIVAVGALAALAARPGSCR